MVSKCPVTAADHGSARGEARLLVLDGHGSHLTLDFFTFCLAHNIHPLCLPAHSTHLLQPLDVDLSRPLEGRYSDELNLWFRKGGSNIKKDQFYKSTHNFAYIDPF